MTETKPIRRIAIIGTGVIGASWSSLYLAKGLQVVATDPAPNAEAALRKFVETPIELLLEIDPLGSVLLDQIDSVDRLRERRRELQVRL